MKEPAQVESYVEETTTHRSFGFLVPPAFLNVSQNMRGKGWSGDFSPSPLPGALGPIPEAPKVWKTRSARVAGQADSQAGFASLLCVV
jgi:hypothetical protein